MNLQTFHAPTIAECMNRVKAALGPDALILHTRNVTRRRFLGLFKFEVIEITAGKGEMLRSQYRRPARKGEETRLPPSPPVARPNPYASQAASPPRSNVEPVHLLDTGPAQRIQMRALNEQVEAMRKEVSSLVTIVRASKHGDVPEDLCGLYTTLLSNSVAEEIATDIINSVKLKLRPELRADDKLVRAKLSEEIAKLIPTTGAIQRHRATGPHVVALIGPTGVGKTTTTAKLAAQLALREGHRVALVTTDTFRIAAIEQLKKYAELIGCPLEVANSPEKLKEILADLQDMDFILIDTAGRSPNDALRLAELRSFLDMAKPDEVHLVLSTTCGPKSIELATERFGQVRADKVIFTKLDESAQVGVVLDVVRKLDLKISYLTTGQEVPKDIEVCDSERVARLIMGGTL